MSGKNEMLALADKVDRVARMMMKIIGELPFHDQDAADLEAGARALRAAASAEPVAWQPIETAPKIEGVFILAYAPGRVMDTMAWDDYRRAWMNGYDDRPSAQPTHWMPLPQPPETTR